MDDTADPILNFFSAAEAEDETILYKALDLEASCSTDDIKRAYRRQALKYHPDKHASKGEAEREKFGREFQKVGFAYAVLSDEVRRKRSVIPGVLGGRAQRGRYDQTGRTDENQFADAEAMGWDAYFDSLWQRVDRKMLDEHKVQYQGRDDPATRCRADVAGSKDEEEDVVEAYNANNGSLAQIMESIPHSAHTDEPRFVKLVNGLIASGTLKSTKKWQSTSTDAAASVKRRKAGEREAKEAEETAKELGVWDEFYGSGSKGKRQSEGKKGKGKAAEGGDGGEDALQSLILKRQRDRAGAMDALEEKYKKIEEDERERKKTKKAKKGQKGRSGEENEALVSRQPESGLGLTGLATGRCGV